MSYSIPPHRYCEIKPGDQLRPYADGENSQKLLTVEAVADDYVVVYHTAGRTRTVRRKGIHDDDKVRRMGYALVRK